MTGGWSAGTMNTEEGLPRASPRGGRGAGRGWEGLGTVTRGDEEGGHLTRRARLFWKCRLPSQQHSGNCGPAETGTTSAQEASGAGRG